MAHKTYALVTSWIFFLIALLHLLRVVYRWGAVIGGWSVPMWLSWAALVIAAYLAYHGMRLGRGA